MTRFLAATVLALLPSVSLAGNPSGLAGRLTDIVVLATNPVEDIDNTRMIARVYLAGQELNRAKLLRPCPARKCLQK